jgi:phosphoribosyl 1,2-cyclic phosphate phosphodiesterase
VRRAEPLPFYGSADTIASLRHKFGYILDETMKALPGTYKPEGRAHVIEAGQTFTVGDATVVAVPVPHGPRAAVLGFRVGPIGYVTDAKEVPDQSVELLRGVEVLVVNALFRTEHPTHLSIPEAVAVARRVGAARTYLTHLTHESFHADLESTLPAGVTPAFDGLTVRVD